MTAEPETIDAAAKVAELQRELERSQAFLADLEARHPKHLYDDDQRTAASKHASSKGGGNEEPIEPRISNAPAEKRNLKSRLTSWFRGSKPAVTRSDNSERRLSYSRIVLDFSPDGQNSNQPAQRDGAVEPSQLLPRATSLRQLGNPPNRPQVINSFHSFTSGRRVTTGEMMLPCQHPSPAPELDSATAAGPGSGSGSRRFSMDDPYTSRALLPTMSSSSRRRSTSDDHYLSPCPPVPMGSVRFRDSVFTASTGSSANTSATPSRCGTHNGFEQTLILETQPLELPPLTPGPCNAAGAVGRRSGSQATAGDAAATANDGSARLVASSGALSQSLGWLSSSPTAPSAMAASGPAQDTNPASLTSAVSLNSAGALGSVGNLAHRRRSLSLRASSLDAVTGSQRLSFVDAEYAHHTAGQPQPPQQQQQQQQPVWILSTSPDRALSSPDAAPPNLHALRPSRPAQLQLATAAAQVPGTYLAPCPQACLRAKSSNALRLSGIPEADDGGSCGGGQHNLQPPPVMVEVELRDGARRKSLCRTELVATGPAGPTLIKSRSSRPQTWGVEAFSGLDQGL